MYCEFKKVEEVDEALSKFNIGKGTHIGNFLLDTLLEKYKECPVHIANDKSYLEAIWNCATVLYDVGYTARLVFLKEMILALALLNIRYLEEPKILSRVLGIPGASVGVAQDMFDHELSRMPIDKEMVYRFLIDIHTCGMAPGTTTMAGKNDIRTSSFIRDIWLVSLLNPDTFCDNWSKDYCETVTNPTPQNLVLAIRKSWLKAKTLFGKSGTYKVLTPYVRTSDFYMKRLQQTQHILADEEEYNKHTSVEHLKSLIKE